MFIAIIVVVTAVWVYFDAKAIGVKKGQISGFADMGPAGWFFATLLLWIVGFPLYLATRGEFKRINSGLTVRKCPQCAEEIKAEAVKCRFCGAIIEPLPMPQNSTASGKRKTDVATVVVGIIVLILLVVYWAEMSQFSSISER